MEPALLRAPNIPGTTLLLNWGLRIWGKLPGSDSYLRKKNGTRTWTLKKGKPGSGFDLIIFTFFSILNDELYRVIAFFNTDPTNTPWSGSAFDRLKFGRGSFKQLSTECQRSLVFSSKYILHYVYKRERTAQYRFSCSCPTGAQYSYAPFQFEVRFIYISYSICPNWSYLCKILPRLKPSSRYVIKSTSFSLCCWWYFSWTVFCSRRSYVCIFTAKLLL